MSIESSTGASPSSHRPPVFLTPAAKKCNRVNGERRPLQEWLIQLLALKSYRKHDLILRLEKSNTFPRDQAELLSALDVVGQQNPKDGKYSLKEDLYNQVQKDWMGYTPEERQHLAGILSSRKHPNISLSQNGQAPVEREKTHSLFSSQHNVRTRPPDAKRPAGVHTIENDNCKRIKSALDGDLPEQHSSSSFNKHVNSRHQTGYNCAKKLPTVSEKHRLFPAQSHKKHSSQRTLHAEMHKRTKDCDGSQIGKVKHRNSTTLASKMDNASSWLKERKRDHDSSEEEEEEEDWEEEALLLERCLTSPEEKDDISEPVLPSEEVPDYVNNYNTIISEDQRKLYEEDFASDYTEYLELHSKIAKVLERFMQLGSRMKKFQPGTVEHKMVENKILSEYKKFKKTYPTYSEEKSRCEYLHDKLSHIKHQILEYEKITLT